MNDLYDEDISVYNPVVNEYESRYQPFKVIVEDIEKYEKRGAACASLLRHDGWRILKEFLDLEQQKWQKYLEDETDPPTLYRLQAAMKSLKSIESFLKSCVWESQIATDNRPVGPNQGED